MRSHGESKDFCTEAAGRGIHIVDATCPFVKKIHDLVEEAYAAGYQIVILGDAAHPEVRGINGWCENTALVVHTAEEARRLHADNLFVVCQTTIRRELLDEVTAVFAAAGKKAQYIIPSAMHRHCGRTAVGNGQKCVIVLLSSEGITAPIRKNSPKSQKKPAKKYILLKKSKIYRCTKSQNIIK